MWTSTDRREGVFHIILRYLEDHALRQRVHAQLNKGEALHQLRKFLFFVRDGAVSHKDEEDQNNQAACLNSRWREMRACNDNACGESKSQNFHESLLDRTF